MPFREIIDILWVIRNTNTLCGQNAEQQVVGIVTTGPSEG
jgi:hypothetical protein